jgi:hypothetical protein
MGLRMSEVVEMDPILEVIDTGPCRESPGWLSALNKSKIIHCLVTMPLKAMAAKISKRLSNQIVKCRRPLFRRSLRAITRWQRIRPLLY